MPAALRVQHYRQPQRFTLDSFVCGPESLLPFRVAQAVATSPGTVYNPVYFHSGPGLGKTHLLRAIAQRLVQRPDMHRVLYVAAETFLQELTTSIRQHTAEAFRARYRAAGALLIDDVADLAGRGAALDDLAQTIDALHDAGRQVVVSGEGDPATLKGLPDSLRSRFASGLVVRIGKPSLRTRLALARTFATALQTCFTEEALQVLAYRAVGGVNEVETAVRRCAHLVPRGTVVDATMVTTVLRDLLHQAQNAPVRTDIETVLRAVCDEFGVTKDALLSKNRDGTVSQARQVGMYLLREDAGLSVACIGREMERDHSTVLHGCGRIESAIAAVDESMLSTLSAVRANILDTLA
jgi:chromosomal replication initiator protein